MGTPEAYMDLVVNLELLGQLARRRRALRLPHVEWAVRGMEARRFEPLARGDWTYATSGTGGPPQSVRSNAFDEYRADTLRRLEDEKKEFQVFLDRLRAAKDRAEFDQFMSDRGNRGGNPSPAQGEPPV